VIRPAAAEKSEKMEAPFGFDTRVVALWRAGGNDATAGLTTLVRRVTVVSLAVIIVAAAGAYLEMTQTDKTNGLFANEYAIADSTIQDEFSQ
jgi:hypothetical protein